MRKLALSSLVLVLAGAALPAQASETWVVDPAHSEVLFRVRHLVSRVSGRFGEFSGTLTLDTESPGSSTARFVVTASSIDTGNPDRDAHLRRADFFDVERYPEVRFDSDSITAAGTDRYRVAGTLHMRGVDRPVVVDVDFLGFAKDPWGKQKAGFTATTTLDRKEFGMLWNKALDTGGLLVGDEVQVEINLEAVRQPPQD